MRENTYTRRRASSVVAKVAVACIISTMLFAVLTGLTKIANSVTISDNGQTYSRYTIYNDVDQILEQEGITLAENDELVFTGFENDKGTITILRAMDVIVQADGETLPLVMTQGTVSDALATTSITLGEEDLLNVELTDVVTADMTIEVTRVAYEDYTETSSIAFDTIEPTTKPTAKGKIVVDVEGENGEKTTTYRNKLVNGEVVETKLIADEVTKVPVSEVKKVVEPTSEPTKTETVKKPTQTQKPADSSKDEVSNDSATSGGSTTEYYVGGQKVYCEPGQAPIELDANGNPVNYRYKVSGKATAYSALGKPTKLTPGCVAMNLDQYPRGTQLYVKTADNRYIYGYSRVADTGEFAYNGSGVLIDLFFNTYEESRRFGAKTMDVYVL